MSCPGPISSWSRRRWSMRVRAYLYVGILRHYAVDRQGELARLHMNSVVRRPIGEDRKPGQEQQLPDPTGRFYPITGDELVIVFKRRSHAQRPLHVPEAEGLTDRIPEALRTRKPSPSRPAIEGLRLLSEPDAA